MGYFAHDAILAVAWEGAEVDIDAFRDSLPDEWRPLVIGPIPAVVNFDEFYAFLPDGSKEGWFTSHDGDEYRKRFVELFKNTEYADIVSVRFGGDFQTEHGKPRVEVLSPSTSKD